MHGGVHKYFTSFGTGKGDFERQTSYASTTRTLTARCAICGTEKKRKKKWCHSRDKNASLLRLEFNFCGDCGRWICEDCYWADDGAGNGIGICRECGERQGITGMTVAEALAARPELPTVYK
jgi:hypothetical protein